MSQKENTKNIQPMGRGPRGGASGPPQKAKDFKGTLKKLVKYMRVSMPAIIIAFLFAIASVILTINLPNITGDATDTLISGFIKKDVYSTMDEVAKENGFADLSDMAAAMGVETYEEYISVMVSAGYMTADDVEALNENLGQYKDGVYSMNLNSVPKINIDALLKLLSIAAILVFVGAALSYIQSFILSGVAQKTAERLRKDIYEKFDKLPLKYYDNTTNGNILSYLTNDVDLLSTTLSQSISQFITSITTIVGVLVMMIRINLLMTGAAIVILPISVILIMLVVKRSQKYFVKQQKALAQTNAHIEEVFSGQRVVQLYNAEAESEAEFKKHNDELAKSGKMSQFLSGLMMPIMNFIGNLSYVVVCVLGGVLVINGKITVGNIQAFNLYIRNFNQPIAQLANIMNTLQSTVAASERIFEFLEADEEVETGNKQPQNVKGGIEFKNVKFGYLENKTVINDFSSTVSPGERVAIVGPTGAGKTTIVKLLMRYYDINGGQILLDGVDINEYDRAALREEFGMVLQDTWLFNGTIMENLRYGNLDATDEEVIQAAKTAGVDHFIRTMEGGYNFVINEDADNISAGQKQLLTITRSLLKNPKVLILDEATSSVDTRTEALIQQVMENFMKDKTCFIIAHRLSTIKNADKILVLRDGDIVEQGNHDQLLLEGGFYSQLYNSQFA